MKSNFLIGGGAEVDLDEFRLRLKAINKY
jgi:hypothetical protein